MAESAPLRAQTTEGPCPMVKTKRPLTLRDVSEASGVSEMTVSRVLRDRGDVSDATKAKVLEAAKKLGYVPNQIAGALASSRVNLVAVIIPSMSNMVFPEVMTGITEVLDDTPFQPVIGITNYSPEREEKVLYEMLSGRRAFRRESAVETMNAILKEDPLALSETGPAIPPGIGRVGRGAAETPCLQLRQAYFGRTWMWAISLAGSYSSSRVTSSPICSIGRPQHEHTFSSSSKSWSWRTCRSLSQSI